MSMCTMREVKCLFWDGSVAFVDFVSIVSKSLLLMMMMMMLLQSLIGSG